MVDDEDEDSEIDSDEDEGEIGGNSAVGGDSDAGSTAGGKPKGAATATDNTSSKFVSSVKPSAAANDEESKSIGSSDNVTSGWDEGYLEDIFGAVEDIDYDDEVALEMLGE